MNARPPACKADALPLSYAPVSPRYAGLQIPNFKTQITKLEFGVCDLEFAKFAEQILLVGPSGFEPETPVLSGLCSNQLSYGPDSFS